MKAATSLINRGLIAHSTETAATIAVMIAGMAATSENNATTRLCNRAPARAARRAARRRASSIEMRMMRMTTTKPSPTKSMSTTVAVGMMGVTPAKTRNVAKARTNAAPTTTIPKRPVGRLSSRSADARGDDSRRPSQISEPKSSETLRATAKSRKSRSLQRLRGKLATLLLNCDALIGLTKRAQVCKRKRALFGAKRDFPSHRPR